MSDPNDNGPITGHDPTNGLAGDTQGEDGGALAPDASGHSLAEDIVAGLDPDRSVDNDDAATNYSEEGKP